MSFIISLNVTMAISPNSRIMPMRCTHASNLRGTGRRRIISIRTNRMRPPSNAGRGSKLNTPTLMAMAMGMGEKGVLHTIDINDEIEDFTRNYIERSGLAGQIVFHIGDACEIIVAVPTGPLIACKPYRPVKTSMTEYHTCLTREKVQCHA